MSKFLQTHVLIPIRRKKNAMANQANIKRELALGRNMTVRVPALIAALQALAIQQQAVRTMLDSLEGFAVRPAASAPAADRVQGRCFG